MYDTLESSALNKQTFDLLISQNEIESGKIIFSEHLPLSKLQQGIKSGSYLQGTFRASRENYLEATVWIHGDKEDEKEVGRCTSWFVCLHKLESSRGGSLS